MSAIRVLQMLKRKLSGTVLRVTDDAVSLAKFDFMSEDLV